MPSYEMALTSQDLLLIEVKCLICREHLLSVHATSQGQITHCSVTQKFVVSDGRLRIREHSAESYSPLRIWAHTKMPLEKKELRIRQLLAHLRGMRNSSRMMFDSNISRCEEYLSLAQKAMLDSAVADARRAPEKAYDVKISKDKVAELRMWKIMLKTWANAMTDLLPEDIEMHTEDTTKAVRFARIHSLDIPEYLSGVK